MAFDKQIAKRSIRSFEDKRANFATRQSVLLKRLLFFRFTAIVRQVNRRIGSTPGNPFQISTNLAPGHLAAKRARRPAEDRLEIYRQPSPKSSGPVCDCRRSRRLIRKLGTSASVLFVRSPPVLTY